MAKRKFINQSLISLTRLDTTYIFVLLAHNIIRAKGMTGDVDRGLFMNIQGLQKLILLDYPNTISLP